MPFFDLDTLFGAYRVTEFATDVNGTIGFTDASGDAIWFRYIRGGYYFDGRTSPDRLRDPMNFITRIADMETNTTGDELATLTYTVGGETRTEAVTVLRRNAVNAQVRTNETGYTRWVRLDALSDFRPDTPPVGVGEPVPEPAIVVTAETVPARPHRPHGQPTQYERPPLPPGYAKDIDVRLSHADDFRRHVGWWAEIADMEVKPGDRVRFCCDFDAPDMFRRLHARVTDAFLMTMGHLKTHPFLRPDFVGWHVILFDGTFGNEPDAV